MNVTEARKAFSQLLKKGERTEIHHPAHTMVLISKKELSQLEHALYNAEFDLALERNKGQRKYTTEEVDAMITEVMEEAS